MNFNVLFGCLQLRPNTEASSFEGHKTAC